MSGFMVLVEFGNDDDPPNHVLPVGPFRSWDTAKKVCDRIEKRTEKLAEVASEASMALVTRHVMVYRCRAATEVIEDLNEYLGSYAEESEEDASE